MRKKQQIAGKGKNGKKWNKCKTERKTTKIGDNTEKIRQKRKIRQDRDRQKKASENMQRPEIRSIGQERRMSSFERRSGSPRKAKKRKEEGKDGRTVKVAY